MKIKREISEGGNFRHLEKDEEKSREERVKIKGKKERGNFRHSEKKRKEKGVKTENKNGKS